ncbi:MAG: hypothetical protein BJ554DRAFT_4077, partial [Olpidium bornovanus]
MFASLSLLGTALSPAVCASIMDHAGLNTESIICFWQHSGFHRVIRCFHSFCHNRPPSLSALRPVSLRLLLPPNRTRAAMPCVQGEQSGGVAQFGVRATTAHLSANARLGEGRRLPLPGEERFAGSQARSPGDHPARPSAGDLPSPAPSVVLRLIKASRALYPLAILSESCARGVPARRLELLIKCGGMLVLWRRIKGGFRRGFGVAVVGGNNGKRMRLLLLEGNFNEFGRADDSDDGLIDRLIALSSPDQCYSNQ